ncbi:MAG: TGS domain-containing protein [Candidatus Bathyarchaeia archaeon]
MVANLPAEAKAKWAQVAACRSIPEKIELMREFISLVPKHKGTNKLLGNVRRRIAELERELEKSRARKKGGRGGGFSIPKEGAGQIIVLGPTNVGRSSLLASVTNAKPEISPLPYTTQKPVPGMLPYKDIQFQLVEAPALVEGAAEGKMSGSQILGMVRNADGLILMVDLSVNPIAQFMMMNSELEKSGILIEEPEGQAEVIRRSSGVGIQIIGGGVLVDCTAEDVRRMLSSYRVTSALVKIRGKIRLDDIEESLYSNTIYKPTLIIANKTDVNGAYERFVSLKEALKEHRIPLLAVSCQNNQGLEKLGEAVFKMLGIIRVYTKEPNAKEPTDKPVVAEEGTTVIDIAKKLHSELYRKFKFARVWGPSAKYPGEKVGVAHMLQDGDVIEIH